MARLILVKHSLPELDPSVPASQWRLSEEGRVRCTALAGRLSEYRPDRIVTSTEPKASETGQIVGRLLGLGVETAEGLHEHDRNTVGWLTRDRFEQGVSDFFRCPERQVFGSESADEAYRRFSSAVSAVIRSHPTSTTVIVTHGTVLSLFVSRASGLEAYGFWRRLGLPSFSVFSLPDLHLEAVVERI